MVVTKEVNLPEFKDLETPELNLSTAALMTAAPYLGIACEGVNAEFMLCRLEQNDARACIGIGKQVTACATEVFRGIKDKCRQEYEQYLRCIDQSSGDYKYMYCRETQAAFDYCMDRELCLSRPDFGYFCRGRVHKTNSQPPPAKPCPCAPKVPDPTPSLPDCKPRIPSRFGSRYFWTND